jgi:hypothetical protein
MPYPNLWRALALAGLCLLAPANAHAEQSASDPPPTDRPTVIDWSNGDAQHTTATCGAFSFSGMQNGGTYELYVNSKTSGTCSFSNSDSPTLTFREPSNYGATTEGTRTLFRFMRLGTNVDVAWFWAK